MRVDDWLAAAGFSSLDLLNTGVAPDYRDTAAQRFPPYRTTGLTVMVNVR